MSDISYEVDPKLNNSDSDLIASGASPKQEAPSCEDVSKRIFTLLTISIINLQFISILITQGMLKKITLRLELIGIIKNAVKLFGS